MTGTMETVAVCSCSLFGCGGPRFGRVAGRGGGSLILQGIPSQSLYHAEQIVHVAVCRHVCNDNNTYNTYKTSVVFVSVDLHCPPRYLTVTFCPTRVDASIVPLNGTLEFS